MSDTELWRQAAQNIHWYETPTEMLDSSNPPFYRWFPDGTTNACYNALDLHVEQGRGGQTALIFDSPVTETKRRYSYSRLLDEVSRFAGALAAQGVVKGDRVIIYLPMVPEALIAMLACARLGAIHSVVFGGFASHVFEFMANEGLLENGLKVRPMYLPDRFIAHAKPVEQYEDAGLQAHNIVATALTAIGRGDKAAISARA